MDNLKEIKEAVYSAKSIAVLAQKTPNQSEIGAILAVFSSLKNIGKVVNMPILQNLPVLPFSPLKKEAKKTFLISFKKNVSEIYYEKKNGETSLYITPGEESISLEDISFKSVKNKNPFENEDKNILPADLLICLGIEEFQSVEKMAEERPEIILPRIKIINIDNKSSNQRYGDFNFIKEENSFCRVCAGFLKNLGAVNSDSSSSLLYGFLKEFENSGFQKSMSFLRWLAKNEADFSLWPFLEKNSPSEKLLSEIFKKVETEKNFFPLFSASLPKETFEPAQASSKDIGAALSEIKERIKCPCFLLLYESANANGRKKITGIFYSNKSLWLEKISQKIKGKRKGQGFVFLSLQNSLISAKKEVLAAIA